MAELLYCRYPDCQVGYASIAGDRPLVCPACNMPARWTTLQPLGQPMPKRGLEPLKPYRLTMNDRRFLKSGKIAADR